MKNNYQFPLQALGLCFTFILVTAFLPVKTLPVKPMLFTGPPAVLVPAYFFPYDNAVPGQHNVGPYWSRLIEAAKANNNRLIVIANPNNGPGSGVDWEKQKYTEAINKVRQQTGKVLGYVHLCYGLNHNSAACNGRTLDKIKTEIDHWKEWYNVDGIFFDEAPTSAAKKQWIKDLHTYVKSKFPIAPIIINNFGTYPDPSFYQELWYNVMFEDTAAKFDLNTQILPYAQMWLHAAMIHSMTSGTWQQRATRLKAQNYLFYYITSDGGSNPYDTLPSFFEELFN